MRREIENAKIKSVDLHRARGIPTFTIHLKGDGWGQGFGQYDLRWWGVYPLFRVMDVVGVRHWSDLPGETVRVDHEHSKVHGIGHAVEDKWFYPDQEKDEDERQDIGGAPTS